MLYMIFQYSWYYISWSSNYVMFYRNCFTVIMNAAAKVYGISSLESMVGFISGILRDKTMADKLMYMPNNEKSKLPLL